MPIPADPFSFPADFTTRSIPTNGTTLHVRTGGRGPAVLLLHGYGETGDMWAPLAAELAATTRVIAPDLRGMGHSGRPEGGYDKKTQGQDMAGLLDALGIAQAASSPTISATWSAMRSRRNTLIGSPASP